MISQISLNQINHKLRNNNNVVAFLLVLSVCQKYKARLELLENLSKLTEAQNFTAKEKTCSVTTLKVQMKKY